MIPPESSPLSNFRGAQLTTRAQLPKVATIVPIQLIKLLFRPILNADPFCQKFQKMEICTHQD